MSRFSSALRLFGVDMQRTGASLNGLIKFSGQLRKFRGLQSASRSQMPFGKLYPCIDDYHAESGIASGHYFHQDLLVAQRIFAAKPQRHVDVGSRVEGLVGHLAVFREVEVFDIRPLTTTVTNIVFRRCDVMGKIEPQFMGYCDSLSCLHALEHFGLGRYGDCVDPDGHLKGLDNLYRILCSGGILYLAVPIGPHRIEFNAHRVFGVPQLIRIVSDRFAVRRFSYVNDRGELYDDVTLTGGDCARHFGCNFGLGILELGKS
jgi:hypothetical protein